jgi:hypothetical protein
MEVWAAIGLCIRTSRFLHSGRVKYPLLISNAKFSCSSPNGVDETEAAAIEDIQLIQSLIHHGLRTFDKVMLYNDATDEGRSSGTA